jgi:hypothetical protein
MSTGIRKLFDELRGIEVAVPGQPATGVRALP